jgi:hypothetical protein
MHGIVELPMPESPMKFDQYGTRGFEHKAIKRAHKNPKMAVNGIESWPQMPPDQMLD